MAGASKVAARPMGSGNECHALGGDAMEGFAPPVVGGNVEARDGAGLVDELSGFFFEGHAVDEIGGALFGGEVGVEVGGFFGCG